MAVLPDWCDLDGLAGEYQPGDQRSRLLLHRWDCVRQVSRAIETVGGPIPVGGPMPDVWPMASTVPQRVPSGGQVGTCEGVSGGATMVTYEFTCKK